MRRGNPPLNTIGGEQVAMLVKTASGGHLDIVRYLLKCGVDVNIPNGEMGTAPSCSPKAS